MWPHGTRSSQKKGKGSWEILSLVFVKHTEMEKKEPLNIFHAFTRALNIERRGIERKAQEIKSFF